MKKHLSVRYGTIQGCYWMGYAALMGYASVYLLEKGFTNTQIGLLTAVGCIVSAVLQPALASYADRPESPSVRTMLLGANLIQFVLVISLAATAESSSMVVRTLLYGASITMLMLMIPFVNSLGMETIRQGEELDYGIGRGMGSVAYAIASWLLGRLTASFGADMISIWAIALTILFLACVFRFPFKKDRKKAEAEKEETKKEAGYGGISGDPHEAGARRAACSARPTGTGGAAAGSGVPEKRHARHGGRGAGGK